MTKRQLIAMFSILVSVAFASQTDVAAIAGAAPLPGLPGSSVPSSATPSTSVPSSAPVAQPGPMLSAPQPLGSPMPFQSAPPISGVSSTNAAPNATSLNSIESFFQIPARTSLPSSVGSGPPLTINEPPTTRTQRISHHSGVGRFLYHVLDNAGVPVPCGKDAELDPSLAAPATELAVDSKRLERISPSSSGSAQNSQTAPAFHSNPQKIPESELEGVELPAPRDVPSTKQ